MNSQRVKYAHMSAELFALADKRISHEEVVAGRMAVKLYKFVPGSEEKQRRTVALYGYVRALEDQVDKGVEPQKAFELSLGEVGNVHRLLKGEDIHQTGDFIHTKLIPLGVDGLPQNQRQVLLESLYEIVQGIHWDSVSILNGKPLPQNQQEIRHLYASMSGFQMVSDLVFSRDLGAKGNRNVQKLFRTWVVYDSLIDIKEDLSAGLILFKQGDLDSHRINFAHGEVVPQAVEGLYRRLKPQIMNDLVANAKHIRETSFPKPFSYLLWAYFLSRNIKLYRNSYPEGNIVFGENSIE